MKNQLVASYECYWIEYLKNIANSINAGQIAWLNRHCTIIRTLNSSTILPLAMFTSIIHIVSVQTTEQVLNNSAVSIMKSRRTCWIAGGLFLIIFEKCCSLLNSAIVWSPVLQYDKSMFCPTKWKRNTFTQKNILCTEIRTSIQIHMDSNNEIQKKNVV